MRLSNKVLFILGIAWAVFFSISYIATEKFLIKSFLKLENEQINTNMNRVQQALNQVLYALSTFTLDWAHWNDAYDYIEGKNPQFVPNNIDVTALVNSNLNLLMYLNKQGQVLIGVSYDNKTKSITSYPAGLDKYIYPGSILEYHSDVGSSVKGLLLLPSGIMLIAAAGTSYTDLSKPINGSVIAARYLSRDLLLKLADATSLSLALYLPKDMASNEKIKKIYAAGISNANGKYISISNEKIAYGYTILYDVFNRPIGMLRVTVPRSIYATGKEAIHFYLSIFLISGLLLAGIIWVLLRIFVLKRLEYLNKKIKEIAGKKDYTKPILMKENDELTSVATQFNELMKTIHMSYEQLTKQVKEITLSEKKLEATNAKLVLEIHERIQMQEKVEVLHKQLILAARRAGMADISSGILHNVGNVLNNVTTSIGITKEMLENSRIKNLKELAKLLEQHKTDLVNFLTKDPKGEKIIEYIDMLAAALMNDNKHIQDEIINLDKYIGHIKDVVTMQQSLSSVIGMTEVVKIPEVVDDALMLNKAISEDKNINITCDYQFKEKVQLDRVKLLHVIVNLIKNSIEALANSAVQDKQILIRVKKMDDTFFSIEVIDNGDGILSENMTNIFSYGFSTKKSGNGIGLHTSATFIKEMGGKIQVSSDGVGQGAVFTIDLPMHPLERDQESIASEKQVVSSNLN